MVSWHCLVRHQARALNGITPVFQQIQLSAAVAFQETVGPLSRRGRVLIAGGVTSMRNLLLALLQRGQNSHVDPGFFEGASSVRSNRPSRQRSARDSAPRSLHPRNNSAIRRQKSSSAKRLNACWPDASTHKSLGRDGEKAAMTRYRGLTNYYLGIVLQFQGFDHRRMGDFSAPHIQALGETRDPPPAPHPRPDWPAHRHTARSPRPRHRSR